MKLTIISCFTLLLLSTAAAAAPIVYTFQATGSGSLGATVFTDRPFRIAIAADTSQVTLGNGGLTYTTPKSTATIHIEGVGDGTFNHPLNVFNSFQIKTVGISDANDILDLMSPQFSSYQLKTSIGPVPDTAPVSYFSGLQAPGEPLDIGTLTFTSVSGITFMSGPPVPEPAAATAAGMLVLGAAAARAKAPPAFIRLNERTRSLTRSMRGPGC